MSVSIVKADCLSFLAGLPEQSVDLCFFSPPYSLARLYLENGEDLAIARKTDEWTPWMCEVFKACLRVCKGLVACVCEDNTKNYRWGAGPVLLMADLHRAGVHLRKPPIYRRVGIPGSGGPDWLRNDYEFIVCATNGGKLPWSDNTSCGHPPKWAPGGEMSHRLSDGTRRNAWGMNDSTSRRNKEGVQEKMTDGATNHRKAHTKRRRGHESARVKSFDQPNGTTEDQTYIPPAIANPGNVVQHTYTTEEVAEMLGEPTDVVDCNVGGGQMGNRLASLNEAPFPEELATFFVRSFCPPGGTVCDPFSGSGTTAAVAHREGRNFVGCDIRESQVALALRRVAGETPTMFP